MRASFDDLEITSMVEDAAGRKAVVRMVVWGEMEANLVQAEQGLDVSPGFAGLPHDNCPARHWGYIISGCVRVVFIDHEEVYSAGDMYYWPPHHMPIFEEDTVLVEFSPRVDQDALDEAFAALEEREAAGG